MGFLQDRSASLHPVEAQGVTVAIPSCHLEPLVYSQLYNSRHYNENAQGTPESQGPKVVAIGRDFLARKGGKNPADHPLCGSLL